MPQALKKTLPVPPPMAGDAWLPDDEIHRINLVGTTVYGDHFLRRMAKGMRMGRTVLWEIMQGRGKRDTLESLDDRLIELLDAESTAAAERGLKIDALRKRFLRWRRNDAAA